MGDEKQFTKPPTISSPKSGHSMNQREIYATERAKILFGCYRKGDANDPDTYVAAVAAVLAAYDYELIREVTDPRSGIQASEKHCTFMPQAGEVKVYCDAVAASPRYRAKAAETSEFAGKTYKGTPVQDLRWNGHPLTSRQIQQLLDREAFDNSVRSDPDRPTYEELQAKYGKTFGLGVTATETPEQINARWAKQAPSWEQVKEFYEANPDRWQRLVKPREPGMR